MADLTTATSIDIPPSVIDVPVPRWWAASSWRTVGPVDGDGGVGTLDAEASEVFEWPCLDTVTGHIQVVE